MDWNIVLLKRIFSATNGQDSKNGRLVNEIMVKCPLKHFVRNKLTPLKVKEEMKSFAIGKLSEMAMVP
ncbi:hypothetical protein BGZ65_011472, partial [Modicella reniformis]